MNYYLHGYYHIFHFFIFSIILAVAILSLSNIASIYNPDVEKLSAYECGFDPYEDARNVFDIQFYLVAILFLVFDIETVYFFPWSVATSFLSSSSLWSFIDFIVELVIGYLYVYILGSLNWN
jgi:NADH:ubiquinone oxidoreductase subunit 3 (subunit A)